MRSRWQSLQAHQPCCDRSFRAAFDVRAPIPQPNALTHPAFAMVRELIQQGKTWVKLSGFYNESKLGYPSYSDSVQVASIYAREGPDRMIWGSGWPQPATLR